MMELVKKKFSQYELVLDRCTNLPPLIFRLILAYGFFDPAIKKITNFSSIVSWFESMGIPFPFINAVMATATENIGFVLLFLGLGTRIITIPLMVVMIVAIQTVHLKHGFSCGDNGFEVPFYYFFMLFSLLITGAGKYSVDAIIKTKKA